MDLEERVAKVEAEVENNRKDIDRLEHVIEALRVSTERGFAEQRAAIGRGFAELRKDIRWLCGLVFANLTFTVGIIIHLAGII
ncbi:hypothetical protein ACHMW6_08650 [Pseudoduganella sp. UC29_106]|uniref:hypothetical protein n=1 Tax=Pseudoduganella sp. UC29_106 TaxID=3374553 RepID=UPI0037565D63